MKFKYQARTKEGGLRMGIIEAPNKETALTMLQRLELFVTSLEEERPPLWKELLRFKKKVPEKEVVLFTRQLSILVNAGVSLVEGLNTIAAQTKNPHFREIVESIAEQIEGGSMLSQALLRHSEVFPPFYISLVKNGEATGKLSYSLSFLADYLERNYEFKENLKGALIYPIFVFSFAILVFFFLSFFVLPSLEKLFLERELKLPFFTQIVFSLSRFLRKNLIGILILVAGIFAFIFSFLKREEGKEFWDRYSLRLPFFGEVFKRIYIARIGENLSLLISSGIPITRAFEMVAETVGNTIFKNILLVMKDEIKKGSTISRVTSIYPELFSPFFVQMVTVGERTGTLDKSLLVVASFHQKEVERILQDFLKILEPVLLIILGVVVGFLVGSIIIPIYRVMMTY